MIEVGEVDAQTDDTTQHTDRCRLRKAFQFMFADGIHQPGNDEEEDDEQIIIGHLHVVRIDLKRREDSRHQQSPKVFPAIGQHQACNHRRQVGQCPHLPDVSCGDDDEEIGGEGPEDRAQGCQVLTEIKGPQQNIEAQKIGKHVPNVLRQPQMVGVCSLRQQIGGAIRRGHLIGRHTAEQGIRPTGTLSRTIQILDSLLSCPTTGGGIMPIEDAPLDVGREEIGERQHGKQQHCQHIGQTLLQTLNFEH